MKSQVFLLSNLYANVIVISYGITLKLCGSRGFENISTLNDSVHSYTDAPSYVDGAHDV